MSKVNDIKNLTRKKTVTPTMAISTEIEEEEQVNTKENNIKIERKRVSFDIRTDLHKELKMQSLIQDKNIYIMIEEAIEQYLNKLK